MQKQNNNFRSQSSKKINRWEMLHNYGSYLNSKKDEQIKTKQKYELMDQVKECTFRPNMSLTMNKFKNTDTKIYDRSMNWDRKRVNNIDNWRKKKYFTDNEECKFQPEIHENIFKYDTRKAQDIVINPEAWSYYVNRNLTKKKEDEAWKKIVDKRPGNGAVYLNKLTIPLNIKLSTSKLDPKEEKLKMEDFLPPKHKRASSEYNKKRLSIDSFEIENLIKKTHDEDICVKIPMKFDQAKDYLRNRLFSIELN